MDIRVCVCDFGSENHKSKFVFLILDLAGDKGARPAEARRGGFGVKKKTRLINGSGSSFWDKTASRVRVWKNPTQTRPVAIPKLFLFDNVVLVTLFK